MLIGCTKENIGEYSNTSNEMGTFTDSRDNQTYNWVKIGTQVWMADDLAYLPSVNPYSQSSWSDKCRYVMYYEGTDVKEAKAYSNMYNTYGVFYNWYAALSDCPPGWHLPSDAEWTILSDYLTNNGYGFGGSGSDIAKSLASISGPWNFSETSGVPGNDWAQNNRSGFTARKKDSNGCVDYWTSSEVDGSPNNSSAWFRRLCSSSSELLRFGDTYLKIHPRTVRCLKDE